jgi:hypothetical protein
MKEGSRGERRGEGVRERQYLHSIFPLEYGRGLESDVISETSGHFKRLLTSMLTVRTCACDRHVIGM